MNEELPELPDAIAIRTRLVPDGPEITVARGFSDEMMRSYALSAVLKERERCARIVETASVSSTYKMRELLAAAIREKAPLKEGE